MKYSVKDMLRLLTVKDTGHNVMTSTCVTVERIPTIIRETGDILVFDWKELFRDGQNNARAEEYIKAMFRRDNYSLSGPSILCHPDVDLPIPFRNRLICLD